MKKCDSKRKIQFTVTLCIKHLSRNQGENLFPEYLNVRVDNYKKYYMSKSSSECRYKDIRFFMLILTFSKIIPCLFSAFVV